MFFRGSFAPVPFQRVKREREKGELLAPLKLALE
jgi:hypothetical protein